MPSRISAGLVIYRMRNGCIEVLLAHPGGPFFAHKDAGHWSIPKGEIEPEEDYLKTAIREVKEELGIDIDLEGPFFELGWIKQKGGKVVHAWAAEHDFDDSQPIQSMTFEVEWPPGSGKKQAFPEVDRAQFYPLAEAKAKIKETQMPLLDRLEELLKPSQK